jgi:hypothetical protein
MPQTNLRIEWVDVGREPTVEADPDYPDGIDMDFRINREAGVKFCQTALPHPTRRCGYYVVRCVSCGLRVLVTTAGRADDPRSVKITCRLS